MNKLNIIVTTEEELRAVVRDAVEQAVNHDPEPELLSTEQMAKRLDIRAETLRRLVDRDAVPHFKVGRLLRFRPAEVVAWYEDRSNG